MKSFTFRDPVYRRNLRTLRGTYAELKSLFRREYPECRLLDDEVEDFKAITMTVSGALIVFFGSDIKSKSELRSCIVHEVVHLARSVLGNTGMTMTRESEEAYAYYQEYLYDTIARQLGVA